MCLVYGIDNILLAMRCIEGVIWGILSPLVGLASGVWGAKLLSKLAWRKGKGFLLKTELCYRFSF